MRIRETRLPLTEVAALHEFTLESAKTFRPLPAPVYLMMEKNQKLISIKAPFDFFTPADLEKLKAAKKLYFSPFMKHVEPFVEAAREVRKTLSFGESGTSGVLEPAGFEISDAVLRILAKLWAADSGIETYFIAAFANEFCDPLPKERLIESREDDVESYELALLRAGAVVFFALHLGYLDLSVLHGLRDRLIAETLGYADPEVGLPLSKELEELCSWVMIVIPTPEISVISGDSFLFNRSRVTQKLAARLFRIHHELSNDQTQSHSVYGDHGILIKDEVEEAHV